MNMLYEGLKENSTIVIVPSTAVESMQLGGLAGMTALTMGLGQERANGDKAAELKKQPIVDTPPAREIINGINHRFRRAVNKLTTDWLYPHEINHF